MKETWNVTSLLSSTQIYDDLKPWFARLAKSEGSHQGIDIGTNVLHGCITAVLLRIGNAFHDGGSHDESVADGAKQLDMFRLVDAEADTNRKFGLRSQPGRGVTFS